MGLVARVITTSFTRALIPIPMVPLLLGPVVVGVMRGVRGGDEWGVLGCDGRY